MAGFQRFLLTLLVSTAIASSIPEDQVLGRQNQIVFPPANGPCPQNVGKAPPTCDDTSVCVSVPSAGICNIQTQNGFPICGCCEAETVNCAYCGGDAGGGICSGVGPNGVGYQGCPCSTGDDGEIPVYNQTKVCPEDFGRPTAKCDDSSCGGATFDQGICTAKTFLGQGGLYRHCSCCPADEKLGCDDCGGDAGDGVCKGIQQYRGTQFQGCSCTPGSGSGGNLPPPIIPFPIPPPGFPIVPPGTPSPEKPCASNITIKCSDCDGKDNWCQSGDNVGCPCLNDCPTGDNEPQCSDEACQGDQGKCTVGPNQDCSCKADSKCPTGVDIPTCSDSSCGGSTNSSIISSCKGDPDGKNKDCTCFQYLPEPGPDAIFTSDELDQQQTFISQLTDLGAGNDVCPDWFQNNTVLTFDTTGNFLSINFDKQNAPEIFNNTGAEWRFVETTGFVANWTVTFQPENKIANTSEGGTVFFSIGSDNVDSVAVEASLTIPANGDCTTDIKIAVDAACPNSLPSAPPISQPSPSCPTSSPNPHGTNFNVNVGCVLIRETDSEDTSVCAGTPFNVADKGVDNNFAFVFACFPSDSGDSTTHPGCSLNATWPRGYGDVYWGQDNCLYDSGGNKINGQCASATDQTVGDVKNPYYSPPTTTAQPTTAQQPTPTTNPFPACTGVDFSKLNCANDCCGFIPCSDWCYANCGGAGVSHC